MLELFHENKVYNKLQAEFFLYMTLLSKSW